MPEPRSLSPFRSLNPRLRVFAAFLTLISIVAGTLVLPGNIADSLPGFETKAASSTVVISEFRARGPSGGNDEFIELYNLSGAPVDISGWKINGSNASGTTGTRATVPANVSLGAGCYYLLTNATATGGYSGSVPGNQTYLTGVTDDGGIGLLNASNTVIDQVGMSAGSAYKEGTPLASLGSTTASNLNRGYERKPGGASGSGTDTDDNSSDFQLTTPSNPQTGCTAGPTPTPTPTPGPTNPAGVGVANPGSVLAGGSTLLTVTVTPGANPASTGLSVTADLSAIGGAASQPFFDNGTNGDATGGDNVFSYSATVAAGTSAGAKSLPATILDAEARTGNASVSLTVTSPISSGQPLPFAQDWSNTGLITTNNVWSGVPGIVGYRGDNLSNSAGTNPQTVLADGSATPLNVTANATDTTLLSGGLAEFELANPVVAFQGSGTADAPHLVISVDTTGASNIGVFYTLRDVDGTADNSVQPVALQYRIGNTGGYTNIPAGFVADASAGPSASGLETPVAVLLPVAAENQPLVQLRIITNDAVGSDEWIGIDNIQVVPNGTIPISGSGSASPSTVAVGANTLLTVTVNPATNPTSTGITVTGDLSLIGGSNAQLFFDDGTNGDATAGDRTFSYLAPVASNALTGSMPVQIADGQGRTATTSISLIIQATRDPALHLTMGNPSDALVDANALTNYLLAKPEYAVGYNCDRGIPNWVSWHLDASWLGGTQRQDDFRPDPTLPAGCYAVTQFDYNFAANGLSRGHHSPSADRTASIPENSATFLMTNMMPQAPGNNGGPWEGFETYARSLVNQGNELYIIAGGHGIGGTGDAGYRETLADGKVTVPALTWKVIIVLPNGTDDVNRVTTATRAFGVIMPNSNAIANDTWQRYAATVDQVEALTGYDFFENVPDGIEAIIEAQVDSFSNTAPTAQTQTVITTTNAAKAITLTATDPNVNNALTYSIVSGPANGTLTGTGANRTYTSGTNYVGTDSFVFQVSDGLATSQATVTIQVAAANVADFTNLQFPSSMTAAGGTATDPVWGRIYEAGVTEAAGASPSVTAQLGYGPQGADPRTAAGWQWFGANYNVQVGNDDEYQGVIILPTITTTTQFSYTYRFSFDGGANWTYADLNGAGSNPGLTFDPAQLGTLTATPGNAPPTSAPVEISGRISDRNGRGIGGAYVYFTDGTGASRFAVANSFGYYRADGLAAGESYVATVRAKRGVSFEPQLITPTESISGLNFVAR